MKKAIVLPYHAYEKLQAQIHSPVISPNIRGNNNILSENNGSIEEKELKEIMDCDLPNDKKAILYQQALFKILKRKMFIFL